MRSLRDALPISTWSARARKRRRKQKKSDGERHHPRRRGWWRSPSHFFCFLLRFLARADHVEIGRASRRDRIQIALDALWLRELGEGHTALRCLILHVRRLHQIP